MTAPAVTCPAWCSDCFVDIDGVVYHRGADVPLPGGGFVRAFAAQDPGQGPEALTFTVYSSEDQEHTYDGVRAFAEAVLEYTERF